MSPTQQLATVPSPLVTEIRSLVDSARQRAAVAVNAELTLRYWQVGQRIQSELLRGERAEYGQQVLPRLADLLTAEYGKGWTQRNLANMVRFAECFSDQNILHALSAKLSWTHFRVLIGIDNVTRYLAANSLRAGLVQHLGDYPFWNAVWL